MIDALLDAYASALGEALARACAAGELPEVPAPAALPTELPKDSAHGDLASGAALALAGQVRRPPREVAEALRRHYPPGAARVRRLEVAGPGFLNAFLDPAWLSDALSACLAAGEDYGRWPRRETPPVLLEFVSANPTGPLNVVSARAAAVGDSLANLLAAAGHAVSREFYVNDAGARMTALGRSVLARAREAAGLAGPEAFPPDGYPGEYVRPVAAALLAVHPDWVAAPEQPDLVDRASAFAVAAFMDGVRRSLERYRVRFDTFVSEEALHRRGAVERVVDRLRAASPDALVEDGGALWLDTTRFGDDKPRVLRRSDGTFTYFTADVAYHQDKVERGFGLLIDLVGPDHHGYLARMRAAMRLLGQPAERLEMRLIQLVRLVRNGEPAKMSKRQGEYVTLDDLLDEVGVDAARFFLVNRHPDSPLDFDLDLARAEVQENPVFYVQYAHARICSILRQAGPDLGPGDGALLTEPEEVALMRTVALLPREVRLAADLREPHRMPRYALDLAAQFHSFYNRHRVLGVPPELSAARLELCRAVALCLRRSLGLIGVSAPERMDRRMAEESPAAD